MPASTLYLKGTVPLGDLFRVVALPEVGTFAKLAQHGRPGQPARLVVMLNTMMADGSPEYPHDHPEAWGEALDCGAEQNAEFLAALNRALGLKLEVA